MSCDVPAARAPPQPLVTCERQSVHEGFLGTHLCVFGLSPRNGGIFFLRGKDVSRLFTDPCGHCRSQHMPTCDVRGRQLALNHLTHMHGTRHAMAPRSDCELLSRRRSVRSASRSSCSSTTSTPSSSCVTLGASRDACQSGGASCASRPRAHCCVVCASSGKPMAGGTMSMPWTLVEDC